MKKVMTGLVVGMMVMGASLAFAEDVYATKNGKKYHKADCLLTKDKGPRVLSMDEALAKSMKPCRRCFPAQGVGVANDAPAADIQITK